MNVCIYRPRRPALSEEVHRNSCCAPVTRSLGDLVRGIAPDDLVKEIVREPDAARAQYDG